MGLRDFFNRKPKNTANQARERLQIIVAQERVLRSSPDYLPTLKRELLEVIQKYVPVEADAIQVHLEKSGNQDLLELNITLPSNDE